jgi:hypothetical protein
LLLANVGNFIFGGARDAALLQLVYAALCRYSKLIIQYARDFVVAPNVGELKS